MTSVAERALRTIGRLLEKAAATHVVLPFNPVS